MNNIIPKISFIIPVYNAEPYLQKCLDSILNQTYKKIEIICINDGSTDGSLKILENFAQKDSRITIITQDNSGTAVARNLGLKIAQAEYVWFTDADDWIEENSVSILAEHIELNTPDIIGFIGDTFNTKTGKHQLDEFRDLSLIPNDLFKKTLNFDLAKNFIFLLPLELWSRIFNKRFLNNNNIMFENKIFCIDDGLFLTECFLKSKNIFYIKNILYHYRVGNSRSLIHSLTKPDPKKSNSSILYAKKCDQILKETKTSELNAAPIILRNIDRMLHIFIKLRGRVRENFYIELQNYIQSSELNKKRFIQKNNCFNLLLKIEKNTYWLFILKSFFIFKFESVTLTKFSILGFTLYKNQFKPNLIKSRTAFSLIKKIIKLKNNKIVSLKYYFAGIPVYIFIDKTPNTN
jgi:glycosyltransferase involved in cell wall biosynthesis